MLHVVTTYRMRSSDFIIVVCVVLFKMEQYNTVDFDCTLHIVGCKLYSKSYSCRLKTAHKYLQRINTRPIVCIIWKVSSTTNIGVLQLGRCHIL